MSQKWLRSFRKEGHEQRESGELFAGFDLVPPVRRFPCGIVRIEKLGELEDFDVELFFNSFDHSSLGTLINFIFIIVFITKIFRYKSLRSNGPTIDVFGYRAFSSSIRVSRRAISGWIPEISSFVSQHGDSTRPIVMVESLCLRSRCSRSFGSAFSLMVRQVREKASMSLNGTC